MPASAQGRFAGRKAVVVKNFDDGHGDRKFPHCIVAGIDRYPRRVTKGMGKKKIDRRSKIKPFVRFVNYNHVMPTRYVCDFDVKKLVDEASFGAPETLAESRKAVKAEFEGKYAAQASIKSEKFSTGASYFFQKLRF